MAGGLACSLGTAMGKKFCVVTGLCVCTSVSVCGLLEQKANVSLPQNKIHFVVVHLNNFGLIEPFYKRL